MIIEIDDVVVSKDSPCLVLVELGINHGGDLEVAINLADLAINQGAKVIKGQTHLIDDEMTCEAKNVKPANADESIFDVINNSRLTIADEKRLADHIRSRDCVYISTPFSRSAVDFLHEELAIPVFKIGSGEADNLPLVEYVAKIGKPVILSTGMHRTSDLFESVQILRNHSVPYVLLECTNVYPAPPESISLSGMRELSGSFEDTLVGFSDHSIGPTMAVAAMALGARIVERHFTDTHYRGGPDIPCSMDPLELGYLLRASKDLHVALNTEKGRHHLEESCYLFARSSLVADQDLPEGKIIEARDIWAMRPGTGPIAPRYYSTLIGKKLRRAVGKYQQLSWDDFEGF